MHHAVFDTADMTKKMKPGDTVSGTVTITNDSDAPGNLTLSSSSLAGLLAPAMSIVITNTSVTPNYVVYSGKLSAMGSTLRPTKSAAPDVNWTAGESDTFSFVITFDDTGKPGSPTTGDNVYQGKDMSVQFDWEAVSN